MGIVRQSLGAAPQARRIDTRAWLRWLRPDFRDLATTNRAWLQRHERAAWQITLACIVAIAAVDLASLFLFADPLAQYVWRTALLCLIGIAGVGLGCRILFDDTVPELQAEEAAHAAAEAAARLQGALLAAQTMQHHLSNQLALTSGYAEMLAENPHLDPALRPLATEAAQGAHEAIATLARLQRLTRVERDPLAGPAILRLDATDESPPTRVLAPEEVHAYGLFPLRNAVSAAAARDERRAG